MSIFIVNETEGESNEIIELQNAANIVLENLANDGLRIKALQSIQAGCNTGAALMASDDPLEQEAGYTLYTGVLKTFIKHGANIYRPNPLFAPVGVWRHI